MTWYADASAGRSKGWPTSQEFNEAIQNPHLSFLDLDLRQSAAVTNVLGIPSPITGNFAAVYRMTSRTETHAVRCFLRPQPEREERYELISEHLTATRLPQAVEFVLLRQGIRAAGDWRPILKMDWVEGATLTSWLDRYHAESSLVAALIDRFSELEEDLASRNIGHGDLQHGNILVVDASTGPTLRLIDYDGMWVPGLTGWAGSERGHANYQHPGRSASDFDVSVDSFSLWSIRASLMAIWADPRLWTSLRHPDADDLLLFSQSDYMNPGRSAVFRAVGASGDPSVRQVADSLRSLCPPSNQVLGLPRPAGGKPVVTSVPRGGLPDWMSAPSVRHARRTQAPDLQEEAAGPTWGARLVSTAMAAVVAVIAIILALAALGVALPGQGVVTDAVAQRVGGVDGIAVLVVLAIVLVVAATKIRGPR